MKSNATRTVPEGQSAAIKALLKISRAVGRDTSLVVWGGGNSSVKVDSADHRGRPVRTLYVKGSGSDMKNLAVENLAPLDLEDLLDLRILEKLSDEDMVADLRQCMLDPAAPRPSIETLLHAFLPPDFVLHTHADATAALVDNPHAKKHVEKCWGGSVALVPYQRPGFGLSKATWDVYRRWQAAGARGARPLRAIMLDKHGLITWGETAELAYAETVKLVRMAQTYVRARQRKKPPVKVPARPAVEDVLPVLRGALSRHERQILCLNNSKAARDFSLRRDAKELSQGGPATPDHLLYTKPRAMYLDVTVGAKHASPLHPSIKKQVERYRHWYESYFKKYAKPGLVKLDSAPRVTVIPGIGVVTTGKDSRTARIGRDIFEHSMRVREGAAGLGGYRSIGLAHVCDFEYWPLENYKLTLAAPEKELSRQVVVITGAGSGIGKACAKRMAAEGACIAALDINGGALKRLADEINHRRVIGIRCDITRPHDVKNAFREVVREWGGMDVLVSNAGLAKCAPVDELTLSDWEASFAVNATGHFLCSREAIRIFKAQKMGGNMVFISSKNVLAPGKDFAAYSASKAAQTQLARVLAIELAAEKVRVNCVTPDGIFEDSRLWDGILESRARTYGLSPASLPDFYANRNLLKTRVYAENVAEAVLFLASGRSCKTTGALLPVDGGVKEAFPR